MRSSTRLLDTNLNRRSEIGQEAPITCFSVGPSYGFGLTVSLRQEGRINHPDPVVGASSIANTDRLCRLNL